MMLFFLEGSYPDLQGRYLSDIWSFTDEKIEKTHDFIQWVFPLDEQSNAMWDAPVLIHEEIEEIRISNKAKENLIKSQNWFLQFVMKNDDWIRPKNHNQRRISRMIKSLRLLHSNEAAVHSFGSVVGLATERNFVNESVINYWKDCSFS